ncbi:unnamed protein product [Cyclocybe aegerita]|uniref:BTB domain-containing protein n=1 Tax=Cyclocybe aegerita TaxID=1973307 RepID=A0A8S0WDL0_CYCAE|nr:unnamed protein product [Cyclocybe aegerita]
MSGTNLTKRKRTDSGDGDASKDDNPTVTRSAEYWLEDGNIILQAENTQYRVHRSILSRQSTVFADMFSLPQPPEFGPGESLVDGCPVVHLQDSAEDVGNLLDLLYESISLQTIEGHISISVIRTMLRLGRKYDFKKLWDRGVSLLEHDYPYTLQKWDEKPKPLISDEPGVIFDVIAIAHENDIKSILPPAYLTMFLRNSLPDIRDGRERLQRLVKAIILDWLRDDELPRADCDSFDKCSAALMGKIKYLYGQDACKLLEYFAYRWDKAELGAGMCEECEIYGNAEYEEGRRILWYNCPQYFELDS